MSYALVTPVKNEEGTIALTLASVIKQTILPEQWVIVSDGSTDHTDEIVGVTAKIYPWIKLIQLPVRETRSFSSVVQITKTGFRSLDVYCDYLGLMDADVKFGPDYYERLIAIMEADPKLGLIGGNVVDPGKPKTPPLNLADVPGSMQFFRFECFDNLPGGLIPIPEGGWDALSCVQARMDGWKTKLVPELIVDHLKPRNSANIKGGLLARLYQRGQRDFAIGYHPIFELVKCIARSLEHPPIAGGIAWWLGYCSYFVASKPRIQSQALVDFMRNEQLERLRSTITMKRLRAFLSGIKRIWNTRHIEE